MVGAVDRVFKRTCFALTLSNGRELRYIDDRQMGRVYYVTPDQLGEIPQYGDMGPDVLDEPLSLGEFKERGSGPFRGEIKGIITRGRVISGIGNAYVDEILWDAEIYPFRKKRDLSDDDLQTDSRLVGASDTRGSWAGQRGNGRGHSSQETRLPEGTQPRWRAVSPLRHDNQAR